MGYSFNFSFSEEDFEYDSKVIKYFSYGSFYINEFFNLNDIEKIKIYSAYREMYGESSYNYLVKNYAQKWKYGDRKISDTQWVRLYTVMENNLTEASRLKLGRIEFFRIIKSLVNEFCKKQTSLYNGRIFKNVSELNKFFQDETTRINQYDLTKNEIKDILQKIIILTEKERDEAFEISELLCSLKLETQIDQIRRDIATFSPFLENNRIPNLNSNYKISSYQINLDIKNINCEDILKPEFDEVNLKYQSKYKDFIDKYLANELIELNKSSNEKSIRNMMNQIDLRDFFENIQSLKGSKIQHSLNYTFFGEGGELHLDLVLRHYTVVITEMAKSVLYILLATLILGGIVFWLIEKEAKILFIFLGFYIVYPYLSIVSPNFKKLLKGYKDLKNYGK